MRQSKRISQTQLMIEQVALLFTSFVWTMVVLSVIVLLWAVRDIESNWNMILGIAPTTAPAPELAFFVEPSRTPWPGPPPSPTPTETLIPSATPTRVIQPPSILPDTPNQDDPTPIPVIVHTAGEAAELLPSATPVAARPAAPATPTSGPNAQPAPPTVAPVPPPPAANPSPPTRLVIPSVGIDSPVVPVGWNVVEQNGRQYSIWQVADYAVGWHETSARPGQPGNMVMAGHHNIKGEVFRDLVNVEVGDELTIYVNETPYRYTIELKTIVKEKGEPLEVRQRNAQWIAPTTDERVTMVTCWPYTNNTHRVIVVAKPG
ncbi:MAG: sortase [Anaerolineae bacterium]